MVVEVVVVFFFLDMESSDDGSSRMGPDTLTSGQTGSCLLPVSCCFENQNPTWTVHSFKNNPTDSFHISNGEKQQQNCCFLFSFFLHYQHLHFSDWSTQLQLHHDEPGDDRSYQLLHSFYITYLCPVYLLTIVF